MEKKTTWLGSNKWHCKFLPLECVKAYVKTKPLHTQHHWIQSATIHRTKLSSMNVLFLSFPAWLLELVLKVILLGKGLIPLLCLCWTQGFWYEYWITQASRTSPANVKIHCIMPMLSVQCQWNIPSRIRLLLWSHIINNPVIFYWKVSPTSQYN